MFFYGGYTAGGTDSLGAEEVTVLQRASLSKSGCADGYDSLREKVLQVK